jgi:hypothetical protein
MNPDFQQIRQLIERRYRRRIRFALHLTLFILALMAVAWYLIDQYPYTRDPFLLAVMAAWGVILASHWGYVAMSNARDREVESAWERVYGKAESDAEDQYAARLVSARLYADEDVEVQDEWIEEKPKRTLH